MASQCFTYFWSGLVSVTAQNLQCSYLSRQLHSPHNSVTFAEQGTEIVPLLTVLVLTFGSEPFLISTTGNTKLRTLIRLQLLEIAGH